LKKILKTDLTKRWSYISSNKSVNGPCKLTPFNNENFIQKVLKKTIEISARIAPNWTVLAKRWVVERTLGTF